MIVFLMSPAPPLTLGNILEVLKGVTSITRLSTCLAGYSTENLEDAMGVFLLGQGPYQPSWRAVIFALDCVDQPHLANRIRNYGEPIQGE